MTKVIYRHTGIQANACARQINYVYDFITHCSRYSALGCFMQNHRVELWFHAMRYINRRYLLTYLLINTDGAWGVLYVV